MFLPTLWAPADWHGMAWHKEMRLGPGQFFGMRGLSFCSAEVWAVVSSDSGLIRKCPIDFLLTICCNLLHTFFVQTIPATEKKWGSIALATQWSSSAVKGASVG